MPAPTLGYDLIPLQRSEVNIFKRTLADCQTDITIDGYNGGYRYRSHSKNGQEVYLAQHPHHETLTPTQRCDALGNVSKQQPK